LTAHRPTSLPPPSRPVAWLLVACFLLQPVLAYLATPSVTQTSDGITVVVCTLHGEKTVRLDLPAPAQEPGADLCPALQLFQIAGTGVTGQPLRAPVLALFSIGVVDAPAPVRHALPVFAAYAPRAPPVA
jgi:hypothetical protein